jgi:hypothetical protein
MFTTLPVTPTTLATLRKVQDTNSGRRRRVLPVTTERRYQLLTATVATEDVRMLENAGLPAKAGTSKTKGTPATAGSKFTAEITGTRTCKQQQGNQHSKELQQATAVVMPTAVPVFYRFFIFLPNMVIGRDGREPRRSNYRTFA